MKRSLSRAHRLMVLCAAILVGLVVRFFCETEVGEWWYVLACAGLVIAVLGRRSAWLLSGGLIALGLTVGAARMDMAMSLPEQASLARHNDSGVDIVVQGRIVDEPERRIADQRLVVTVDSIVMTDKNHRPTQGRILVKLPLFPEYAYGEGIVLRCRLETPFETEEFSYKRYLAVQQIFSVCARPVVFSHGDSPVGKDFQEGMLTVKSYLLGVIHRGLPEPQASLLAGLLIGQGSGFPPLLKKDFSTTGLSHIVAISGYNITIIVVFVYGVLSQLRLSRLSAFWITGIGIGLFALFTGGQAATIRAALMGVLALSAGVVGRPSAVWSLILVSAVVMSLVNPLILIADVGFQLSFLATVGLVVWTPIIQDWGRIFRQAKGIFAPIVRGAWDLLAQTMGAIIMTLPLMLAQFGTLSVIAPLANLLVLPSIPLAMGVGAAWVGVASILDFLHIGEGFATGLLASPAWLILSYISQMTTMLATVPFASVIIPLGHWRWAVMIGLYVVIALAYWLIKKWSGGTRRKTC